MDKNRKMKLLKGFLIFISVLVTVILLLQIDDELDPEVQAMLDNVEFGGSSQAYFYLMGINAAPGDDPIEVGAKKYESIKDAEVRYFNKNDGYELLDYIDKDGILAPDGEAFCRIEDDGCLKYIFSPDYDIQEILKNNHILFERYSRFVKMDDYRTLSRPILMAPFPPYQYVATGSRLVGLNAILEMRKSNIEKSVFILLKNISDMRRQLERADTLIGKMIYLSQISANLDILSVLVNTTGYKHIKSIDPITLDERNFDVVMVNEFIFAYDIVRNAFEDPDALGVGKYTPKWVMRSVFKINISINEIYRVHNNIAERSKLDQKEFASKVALEEHYKPEPSYVRNLVGSILNSISVPVFDEYVGRMFDINAKICLFNQTQGHDNLSRVVENIENPYYSEKGMAYYSEDSKKICMIGPFEEGERFRCLTVAL